uniref:Sulfate transporter-like n=1 Tax=Saccoglossus kowalevskii TaxID=10224 RepID=A0ABM0MHH3_SACKO|nr:PREDICTED: sulfate transporter-like [Saccoglossus kowalevskii]
MASLVSHRYLVSADEAEIDLEVDQRSQDNPNPDEQANNIITRKESISSSDRQVTGKKNNDDYEDIADIGDEDHHQSYQIERPTYTERQFHNEYKENDFEYVPYAQRLKKKIHKCHCGPRCCKDVIVSTLPILGWLPEYVIKTQLIRDIVSGITVCVMNIPQGMAYALLASLPPVYGLYLSFFAPIVYAFTGTSKDLAMGTYAIGSMMVGAAIEDVVPHYPADEPPTDYMNYNNTNTTAMPTWDREQELIDAAVILALIVGIIQLIMAVLHLGWITIYLSVPFMNGYISATACRLFTIQLINMLGVTVGSYSGAFDLFYTWGDIFENVDEWNYVTILLSISCILTIIAIKEIEIRYKKQLHGYPLGSELIVVILGTIASYLLDLEENYGVAVVGEIPAGLPTPSVPSTTYLTDLIGPAFPIVIISYAIAMVVVTLFAQKKGYKTDGNQELVAYGTTNVVVSFFSGFPASGAFDRTLVQDAAGGSSQIAGLVNSAVMLVVLLWIGPFFEALPSAVLASIIMITIADAFRNIPRDAKLYYNDILDFHVWWVTGMAVICFDIDLGLLIGVGFSIFIHVWRTQEPYCTLLGRIPDTELYKDIKWYSDANECPGVKIFCMHSSLYFANTAHFKARVYKLTKINPMQILRQKARQEQLELLERKKKLKEIKKDDSVDVIVPQESEQEMSQTRRRGHSTKPYSTDNNKSSDNLIVDEDDREMGSPHGTYIPELEDDDSYAGEDGLSTDLSPGNKIHTIIIDFSPLNFIDITGLTGLQQLFREYRLIGIKILLAHCKKRVRDFLSNVHFYEKVGIEETACLFVTVHDAVLSTAAPDKVNN